MSYELACYGYGEAPSSTMFVGISAGKLGALQTKVPFTKDASGRLFQRVLFKLGYSETDEFTIAPKLKDCWVTNLVKGRILDERGNNRIPSLKEVEYWWPTFQEEVAGVDPKRILALGNFVWQALGRKLDFTHLHRVRQLKHPRWYASHGALKEGSSAFQQMWRDYSEALGRGL